MTKYSFKKEKAVDLMNFVEEKRHTIDSIRYVAIYTDAVLYKLRKVDLTAKKQEELAKVKEPRKYLIARGTLKPRNDLNTFVGKNVIGIGSDYCTLEEIRRKEEKESKQKWLEKKGFNLSLSKVVLPLVENVVAKRGFGSPTNRKFNAL